MNQPITNLAELAESIQDQPELFAAPDVKSIVAAKEFAHTGRWTMKDDGLVAKIVAAWLNTGSMRRVADLVGVSRNTVSAVVRILEQSGKLEPLKSRFERARLEVGFETLQWLRDVTEARDLEAMAVLGKPGWVGVGIVSDKEAAQPPASLHLHVHQAPTDAPSDPVAEYERILRRARSTAVVDVESAVQPPKSLPPSTPPFTDTQQDTSNPIPAHLIPPPPTDRPTEDPRGGGSDSAGGAGHSDSSP